MSTARCAASSHPPRAKTALVCWFVKHKHTALNGNVTRVKQPLKKSFGRVQARLLAMTSSAVYNVSLDGTKLKRRIPLQEIASVRARVKLQTCSPRLPFWPLPRALASASRQRIIFARMLHSCLLIPSNI
eukprot:3520398-Pleurochrysis_carterae.AAC.3